jgi:hypothetical protein
MELLPAMNTDTDATGEAWVTVDGDMNQGGDTKGYNFPASGQAVEVEKMSDGRAVVKLMVEPDIQVILRARNEHASVAQVVSFYIRS